MNTIKPFLNEIAERLWSRHAAVMIGAGFSKNDEANGEFEELVVDSLSAIAEDTELIATDIDWVFKDKLDLRVRAAGLSYTLYQYYKAKKIRLPKAIKVWEAICNSEDEFAEIRNQWLSR